MFWSKLSNTFKFFLTSLIFNYFTTMYLRFLKICSALYLIFCFNFMTYVFFRFRKSLSHYWYWFVSDSYIVFQKILWDAYLKFSFSPPCLLSYFLLAFYLILYILIHICAILGVISLYLFSSSWFLSFNYCPLWNSFTEFLISVIILHLEFFTELFKKNSIPRFLKNVPLSYSFYFLVSP